MNNDRVIRVLDMMRESGIPQMLVSDSAAIFYLTGKWIHPGERLLALYLNIDGSHKLFINELFPVYEDLGVEKVWFNDTDDGVAIIAEKVEKDKVMGIDKNWPSKFLLRLMELKGGSSFVNGSMILDKIRMCKDEAEKEFMREASRLNDLAVGNMIDSVSENITEVKMAKILTDIYGKLGADGCSFSPIIAYGANAADPHHEPDESILNEGDSIIIDIGCRKNSYCSDMTRTVFYKKVSDKARDVYETVREANERAIAVVKPGIKFSDVDAAARGYIESKGYGKFFTHRTGHSIGIEVHDFGDVSSVNNDVLKPGMIFSIEPGIYLDGEVGVRIEDLVLVTEDGCEVLNKFTKELLLVE